MNRRPPRTTRTDPLFPFTTRLRSPTPWPNDRLRANADRAVGRFRTAARVPSGSEPRHNAAAVVRCQAAQELRSEEHTSELQSLMRISYAVFCLKKKTQIYK